APGPAGRPPLVPGDPRDRPHPPGPRVRVGRAATGPRPLRRRGPGRVPRVVEGRERAVLPPARVRGDGRAPAAAGGAGAVPDVARPPVRISSTRGPRATLGPWI